MAQRNYACDGQIRLYWGEHTRVDLAASGAAAFKGQLYQCQQVQAFVLKQVYEARRARNQLGHLVWMLNEIWPTVGWGSLEYGTAGLSDGQVRGGRWKPLHYEYKRSLMTDVMATCGIATKGLHRPQPDGQACYVSNHRASRAWAGTVTLVEYDHFGDGGGTVLYHERMSLPAGPGAIAWFRAALPPGNTSSLVATVRDEQGGVVSENMVQLARPSAIRVPDAKLALEVADAVNPDRSINITVTCDRVALWVTLTTAAQGRLSDNAFFLRAAARVVRFVPFGVVPAAETLATLRATLRVEDYSMYASLPPPPPAPPSPSRSCDPSAFLNNTDYHDGQGLGHAPAASALLCCELCAERPACNHFTWAAGVCWMKANDLGKRYAAGAVSGACD